MKRLIDRRRAVHFCTALFLMTALLPAPHLISSESAAADGKNITLIDINEASVEELTQLSRIGEVVAKRIVVYRDENGPFEAIEEIMGVRGIGEKVFERIKDSIVVKKTQKKKKK